MTRDPLHILARDFGVTALDPLRQEWQQLNQELGPARLAVLRDPTTRSQYLEVKVRHDLVRDRVQQLNRTFPRVERAQVYTVLLRAYGFSPTLRGTTVRVY